MFKRLFFCAKILVFLSTQLLTAQPIQPIIQQGSNGETVSLWVDYSTEKTTINSIILYPNQPNNEPTVLSRENHLVISQPLFIMNHAGQGIAVWQCLDESLSVIHIESISYSSTLGWSLPQVISDATENIEASNYNLYLDESGFFSVFYNTLLPGQLIKTTLKTTMHHVNDFYK